MAAVGSARAPGDEVLVEMGREVGVIRACIDQFIGGIRPGEEAQVQQARVVQRVQGSLERLAALGQDAHRVLPPSLNEVRCRQTAAWRCLCPLTSVRRGPMRLTGHAAQPSPAHGRGKGTARRSGIRPGSRGAAL